MSQTCSKYTLLLHLILVILQTTLFQSAPVLPKPSPTTKPLIWHTYPQCIKKDERWHIQNTVAKRFANAFLVPHYSGLSRHWTKLVILWIARKTCLRAWKEIDQENNPKNKIYKKLKIKISFLKTSQQHSQKSPTVDLLYCVVAFGIFL